MSFRLWNGFRQYLLEVVTLQWVWAVVTDQVVETVEQLGLNHAIFGLAVVLFGFDSTMIHKIIVSAITQTENE